MTNLFGIIRPVVMQLAVGFVTTVCAAPQYPYGFGVVTTEACSLSEDRGSQEPEVLRFDKKDEGWNGYYCNKYTSWTQAPTGTDVNWNGYSIVAQPEDGKRFKGWYTSGAWPLDNPTVGDATVFLQTEPSLSAATIMGNKVGKWGATLLPVVVARYVKLFKIATAVQPAGAGTTTGDGEYEEGETATLVASPASGYSFERWSDGVMTPNRTIGKIAASETYVALFTGKVYQVTFVANGGETPVPTAKTVSYGSAYGALATCTRAGYVFDGWWTAVSGGAQVTPTTTVTASSAHELHARWIPLTPTVTFDANGGSAPDPAAKTVTVGSPYGPLAATEKTGHDLVGWFTQKSGGEQIQSGTVVSISTNHTLVARWAGKSYKVYFNLNGAPGSIGDRTVTYGSDPVPSSAMVPTWEHHSFRGWYTAGGVMIWSEAGQWQDTGCGWNIASDTEVVAHWAVDEWRTVRFWSDATYGTVSPTEMNYLIGETYGSFPTVTPVSSKNVFLGWFDKNGARVRENDTVPEGYEEMTLRARWRKASYFIAYEGNGATNAAAMAVSEFAFDTPTNLPWNAFGRVGHAFDRWTNAVNAVSYTNHAEVVNLLATQANETNVLFATWKANDYTVRFNRNAADAGGTMQDQAFVYGQPQNLSSNAFTRGSLWTFEGWSNAVSGAVYADGEAVSNLTAVANGVVTLDARWRREVGVLSEAMGCMAFNWRSEGDPRWEPCATKGHAPLTTSAWFEGDGSVEASMSATNETGAAGTLSFYWYPTKAHENLVFRLDGAVLTNVTAGSGATAKTWNLISVGIPLGAARLEIGVKNNRADYGYACESYLSDMAWKPTGDEPQPGEPVAVSSADVVDGVFRLSVPSTVGTDYGVWTNADLQIDSWGLMERKAGTGSPLTFEWAILPDWPQLFFQAHKVR